MQMMSCAVPIRSQPLRCTFLSSEMMFFANETMITDLMQKNSDKRYQGTTSRGIGPAFRSAESQL